MLRLASFACVTLVSLAPAGANPPVGTPASSNFVRGDLCTLALKRLEEGNARFLSGNVQHPNTDLFRVVETGTAGQAPFAAVLTCADSRVPVECLFDRGVGDLFTVRVAGNVCQASELGSIEYAVEHLRVPVLVVMGHTKCGAVKAAASGSVSELPGSLPALLSSITPAVDSVRAAHPDLTPDQFVDAAVRQNVWQQIEHTLTTSSIIREGVQHSTLKIVGAVYNIETGAVEFLGAHPHQSALLLAAPADSSHAAADADHSPAPSATPASHTTTEPAAKAIPKPTGKNAAKKPDAHDPGHDDGHGKPAAQPQAKPKSDGHGGH